MTQFLMTAFHVLVFPGALFCVVIGILLAGIVRQNGQIIIPSGADYLQVNDDVIVVTTDTSLQDIYDIMK